MILDTLTLWYLYVTVMWLKKKRENLNPLIKPFAYAFAALAWICDVVYNLVWGSLWFLDYRGAIGTFTSRLKLMKKNPRWEWQRKEAFWWCEKLNKHDPGHC